MIIHVSATVVSALKYLLEKTWIEYMGLILALVIPKADLSGLSLAKATGYVISATIMILILRELVILAIDPTKIAGSPGIHEHHNKNEIVGGGGKK